MMWASSKKDWANRSMMWAASKNRFAPAVSYTPALALQCYSRSFCSLTKFNEVISYILSHYLGDALRQYSNKFPELSTWLTFDTPSATLELSSNILRAVLRAVFRQLNGGPRWPSAGFFLKENLRRLFCSPSALWRFSAVFWQICRSFQKQKTVLDDFSILTVGLRQSWYTLSLILQLSWEALLWFTGSPFFSEKNQQHQAATSKPSSRRSEHLNGWQTFASKCFDLWICFKSRSMSLSSECDWVWTKSTKR